MELIANESFLFLSEVLSKYKHNSACHCCHFYLSFLNESPRRKRIVQCSVTVRRSDWVPYPDKWTHGCMVTQLADAISNVALCAWADGKTYEKVKIPPNVVPCEPACRRLLFPLLRPTGLFNQRKERKYWMVPCERMSAQSDFSASRKFDRHSRLRHRVNFLAKRKGTRANSNQHQFPLDFFYTKNWQ